MIAVLFEPLPFLEKKDEYKDLAAGLRSELEKAKGLISIERFQSLSDPGKMLSLSFWEDEASLNTWRNVALHRDAQKESRNSIFSHYRLRVAEVIRDYGMTEREQAPEDSKPIHQ